MKYETENYNHYHEFVGIVVKKVTKLFWLQIKNFHLQSKTQLSVLSVSVTSIEQTINTKVANIKI